jgi:hypothetical protein
MADADDVGLTINRIALRIIDLEQGRSWFLALPHPTQREVLQKLGYFALQAGATDADAADAISGSGLRPTDVPCVLLSKPRIRIQVSKIANLNQAEYEKAFRVLVSLLSISDGRRRSTVCREGCDHWWHNLGTPRGRIL